jgi:hypothetical protein
MENLYIKYSVQGSTKTLGPIDQLRAKTELQNLSMACIEAIVYNDHNKLFGVSLRRKTGMVWHFWE